MVPWTLMHVFYMVFRVVGNADMESGVKVRRGACEHPDI